MTRWSTPICGAASPTPSAAYIVSNMSFTSARVESSTFVTGLAFCFRMGSGQMRISRTMEALLTPRARTGNPVRAALPRPGAWDVHPLSVEQAACVLGAQSVIPQGLGRLGQDAPNLLRAVLERRVRMTRETQRVELGGEQLEGPLDLLTARRACQPQHGEVVRV